MTEHAPRLVDEILPHVPVRQWVLSLPHRLRYVLAWDHRLSWHLPWTAEMQLYRRHDT